MDKTYYAQQYNNVTKRWINFAEGSLQEMEAAYKAKHDDKDNIFKYGHRYRIVELSVIKQT